MFYSFFNIDVTSDTSQIEDACQSIHQHLMLKRRIAVLMLKAASANTSGRKEHYQQMCALFLGY